MSSTLLEPKDYTHFLESFAEAQNMEVSQCYVSESKLDFKATKVLGKSYGSWIFSGRQAMLGIRLRLMPFSTWPDLVVYVFNIHCIDKETRKTFFLGGKEIVGTGLKYLSGSALLRHYGREQLIDLPPRENACQIRRPRDLAALFEAYDRLAESTGHIKLFTTGKDT